MFDLTPFDRARRGLDPFFPFREADELERRLFARSLPTLRADVRESSDAYCIEAELPGFQPEEIRVTVKGNRLCILAERYKDTEHEDEEVTYLCRERIRGSLSRSFDLTGICADKITASFDKGILHLTLPKSERSPDSVRSIPIRTEQTGTEGSGKLIEP